MSRRPPAGRLAGASARQTNGRRGTWAVPDQFRSAPATRARVPQGWPRRKRLRGPRRTVYCARFARPPRTAGDDGGVAEWLKAHAWKVCRRETVSGVRIPLPPPVPSNEASPSARCDRKKRNVPKALQVRPLHCAARELRAAFSEWPVSLPTCGLKPPPYGQKPALLHAVRRSGRSGSSSFLWLTKPQSLPNRLLNRSSKFLFEGRRFALCSEVNLG